MKQRSPVDYHLAIVQQIAPSQQAEARDAMRRGVLAHAHAAPIHRLDMHRPERLDGLASLVFRQPKENRRATPGRLPDAYHATNRLQDKAGVPAAGPSALTDCLHVVFRPVPEAHPR
jgi:hypothetical protein